MGGFLKKKKISFIMLCLLLIVVVLNRVLLESMSKRIALLENKIV